MATPRLVHRKLVAEPARRNVACLVVAAVMVLVAGCFLLLAVADVSLAKAVWVPCAVLEALLAVWNLMVYFEKTRIRDGHRAS